MENQENSVKKAVKETVIKTAETIGRLREKSKPFAEEIRDDLKEAGKEAAKLSGQAVDTARNAVQGFKEGIDAVRKKSKAGKNS